MLNNVSVVVISNISVYQADLSTAVRALAKAFEWPGLKESIAKPQLFSVLFEIDFIMFKDCGLKIDTTILIFFKRSTKGAQSHFCSFIRLEIRAD